MDHSSGIAIFIPGKEPMNKRPVSDLYVTTGVWVFRFLNDEVPFEEDT